MRRKPRPPRDRIHGAENARPDSTSARVIARLAPIDSFTYPPDRKRPLAASAECTEMKSPLGMQSPSEKTR